MLQIRQWQPTDMHHFITTQEIGCELPYEENYQEILFNRFREYFGNDAAPKYEHAIVSIPYLKHLATLIVAAPVLGDALSGSRPRHSTCDVAQLHIDMGVLAHDG